MYRIKFKYFDLYIEEFNLVNGIIISIRLTDNEINACEFRNKEQAFDMAQKIGELFINILEVQKRENWQTISEF